MLLGTQVGRVPAAASCLSRAGHTRGPLPRCAPRVAAAGGVKDKDAEFNFDEFDPDAFQKEWQRQREERANAASGFGSRLTPAKKKKKKNAKKGKAKAAPAAGLGPGLAAAAGAAGVDADDVSKGLEELKEFINADGELVLDDAMVAAEMGEMTEEDEAEVQAAFAAFLKERAGGGPEDEEAEGEDDDAYFATGEVFRIEADDDEAGDDDGAYFATGEVFRVEADDAEGGGADDDRVAAKGPFGVGADDDDDAAGFEDDDDDWSDGAVFRIEADDDEVVTGLKRQDSAEDYGSVSAFDADAWVAEADDADGDDEIQTVEDLGGAFALDSGWGVAADDDDEQPVEVSSRSMEDVVTTRTPTKALDKDTTSVREIFGTSSALSSLPAHQLRALEADQKAAVEMNAKWKADQRRRQREGKPGRLQKKLRIITGSAAGKRLLSPTTDNTRPMMEKVRGAVMSSLLARVGSAAGAGTFPPQSRWLDLFAGTGAVGLEALSRGVGEAHFIEMDQWTADACTRKNAENCGFGAQAVVHVARAEDFLRRGIETPGFAGGAFDFVSVCPPYVKVSYPELYDLLDANPLIHERSVVFVEYPKQLRREVRDRIGPLTKFLDRKYGRTLLAMYGPPGMADGEY